MEQIILLFVSISVDVVFSHALNNMQYERPRAKARTRLLTTVLVAFKTPYNPLNRITEFH